MINQFNMIQIADLLKQSDIYAEIDPEKSYQLVTVKLWGKGVQLRNDVDGASIIGSKLFVTKENQFILSKIDARNGAFGLIPAYLDGAVVSSDFPVFTINTSKVLPDYLYWISKTADFVHLCIAASEGTTNRVRLKIDRFLASAIPLPPLAEQHRIVARIEELSAKIEEARGLSREAVEETKSLSKTILHNIFTDNENKWSETLIDTVAEIIDPNPSHRMPQYSEIGIPFISTVDFEGPETIRKKTIKHVTEETYQEQKLRCSFAINDILYSRIGTIGEARILTEIWPFALSHVLVVVKPKQESILPRFLLWYLRSDSIVTQAYTATRSIGVPDLGIKKIREFSIPLPSLEEQKEIVMFLDNQQINTAKLNLYQAEVSAELNALLPSILNKAFKGEL